MASALIMKALLRIGVPYEWLAESRLVLIALTVQNLSCIRRTYTQISSRS